jgi:hypothetical protein
LVIYIPAQTTKIRQLPYPAYTALESCIAPPTMMIKKNSCEGKSTDQHLERI